MLTKDSKEVKAMAKALNISAEECLARLNATAQQSVDKAMKDMPHGAQAPIGAGKPIAPLTELDFIIRGIRKLALPAGTMLEVKRVAKDENGKVILENGRPKRVGTGQFREAGRGINAAWSGFNGAFKKHFGVDAVERVKVYVERGDIEGHPVRGGYMIYEKGTGPAQRSIPDVLDKILSDD